MSAFGSPSMSASTSSGKRRRLDSALRGKRQDLEKAKEELEKAEARLERAEARLETARARVEESFNEIKRWSGTVSGLTDTISGLTDTINKAVVTAQPLFNLEEVTKREEAAIKQREDARKERDAAIKEREYATKREEDAIKEREDARKEREAAMAKVESCQKDLDMLEEQRSSTKRLGDELAPDASKYFRAIVALGAPSDLTSRHAWWKAQKLDRNINPLFLCFVPPKAQPVMPVELAEKVFSDFLVNAKEDVVDEHDCAFTMDLCLLVGQQLENEHDMASKFRKMLTDYLGHTFPVKVVSMSCPLVKSTFPMDGCVIIFGHMSLLAELKLDPKTTLSQAMQYYSVSLADMQEKEREKSFWPCFLIELIGTCIRISGLVYFEKVACQPLTPFLHCYINDFDRSDMNTLCRAMRALKTGVHKLGDLGRPGSAVVTRNKNIPYHLCLRGLEFQQRIAHKLMFVMKVLESGEFKVVKFCRRYGVSVHEAWAEQGLAPKLIRCNLARDGWYAIEMEFLDPAEWKNVYGWSMTSQSANSKSQLQVTIKNALTRAHEININGRKTAHGDMRSPNIMVRESDGSFEVKFVDFDWSGIVGDTLYPSFMNMDLEWHPDVGPGKPLHQEHDTYWLVEDRIYLREAGVGDFEMHV